MVERRRFSDTERAALYLAADGRCSKCGTALEAGWHGDHVTPYSAGGPTDVINGQALCPTCNLKKGDKTSMDELRLWQRRATEGFFAHEKPDFLVSATPGAGKTKFSLSLARRLLDEETVQRIAVVVPTDALRQQWADEAGVFGLDLMPVNEPEDYDKAGYRGCVATYQQVARGAGSDLLRRATRVPTLAILDEVHHAGHDRSWGEGLRSAVENAQFRLALTGTPWRRETDSPIPFVSYDLSGKVIVDYAYEYGAAVADGVCRRIEFHAYDGEAKWIDCGKISSAELGKDLREDDVGAALEAAYRPDQPWIQVLMAKADQALAEIRADIPDAGGLVVAERQTHARAYADFLKTITGEEPTVVISDDPDAKRLINEYRKGASRWLVAVKMVSEGVDIPRLMVGVYASKTRTPLFFRQVVGRFVRVRPEEEANSRLLIPAVPALMAHARQIEEELRHQLDQEAEREQRERQGDGDGQGTLNFRQPLSASAAVFDRAIIQGEDHSPEEYEAARARCRQFGIPTQWAANVLQMLREQTEPAPATPSTSSFTAPAAETPRHRREKMLRREVETLARKVGYRRGVEVREVNTDLLRLGYPKRSKATVEQLEAMLAVLAEWFGEPQ